MVDFGPPRDGSTCYESGFSPSAYSRAKAAGIWQFIAETGRRHGLEVSSYVDERRDPLKATVAALELAAAAYNSGENRIARILRERREDARGNEELFWRIAPHLPQETRDYVPLMLAAGHIGKEPEKYGLVNLDYHVPLTFETVEVPGGTRLSTVARAIKVDADDVAELNPHLVRMMTPPGRLTEVRIPAGRDKRVAFERLGAKAPHRRARLEDLGQNYQCASKIARGLRTSICSI